MVLSKVLEKELLEGRFWTHSRTLVEGCTKVSPGCLNCWSEAMQMRFNGGKPFDGTVIEHPERLLEILPKSGQRKPRVWTYWNDMFHELASRKILDGLLDKIEHSRGDFHIICTKRPEVAYGYFRENFALENLLILVSAENQQQIDERMPLAAMLSEDFGVKTGLLIEPLLSVVSLRWVGGDFLKTEAGVSGQYDALKRMSWVICGPENGKGKRPFDEKWAMRLQEQVQEAGVPFFYKAGLLNGKRYIETP